VFFRADLGLEGPSYTLFSPSVLSVVVVTDAGAGTDVFGGAFCGGNCGGGGESVTSGVAEQQPDCVFGLVGSLRIRGGMRMRAGPSLRAYWILGHG